MSDEHKTREELLDEVRRLRGLVEGQRQANEEALRRVPPWVLQVLGTIDDTLLVLDRDWRFVYANGPALRQAREPLEQLLGRPLWEKYPELLGTPVEDHYRRAMAEQRAAHFETQGALSGRWLEVHAYPSPECLVVFSRDASGRRRVEEALRESEARLRGFFEAAFEGIVIHRDGVILDANESCARMFGYRPEELIGMRVLDLAAPQTREEVLRRIRGGDGRPYEGVGLRKDGSTFPGEVCGKDVTYQGRPARVTAVRDATQRKRAEEELRASEERFQSFMDHSPAIAWIKDEAGRYVYVSRAFEERLRKPAAAVCGRDDFELWPAEMAERFRAADRQVLQTGAPVETVELGPGPGGALCYWHIHKFLFRDAAGAAYVAGMGIDVTDRRRAEEKLQEFAGRLQTLSHRLLEVQEQERRHLARELHDEVGQALTGLRLTLEAARPEGRGAAAGLDQARQLVQELTGKVRELSLRLRPSMLDDLGLLPALLWHLERYTAQTGVQVAFSHQGLGRRLPPEVETAAYRIVQEALTNVARHADVGRCAARLWLGEDSLHIEVEDAGRGYDFEAAYRAGASGGVSGMRERAALLGGRLRVESSPGAGARVTAELPVPPDPGPPLEATGWPPVPANRPRELPGAANQGTAAPLS